MSDGSGWNAWYHVMSNTYGTWLRGDPRGWRTRHHREHVDGDYKHRPAPGTWETLYARSKRLMKRDPVRLDLDLREVVLDAVVDKLIFCEVEVIAATLTRDHLHVLARFADHDPREWLGRAKKHASHHVRQCGLRADDGGLWGKRSKVEPVRDRGHQLNTIPYILDHADQGGATYFFKDGIVRPPRRP